MRLARITIVVFLLTACDWHVTRAPHVLLPPLNVSADYWDKGYISAEGTWAGQAGEDKWPLQTSKIQCHQSTRTCVMATAVFEYKDSRMIFADIERFEVERWTDKEIITQPHADGLCVTSVMRIGRGDKALTMISRRKVDFALCGAPSSESQFRLVSGHAAMMEIRKSERLF